MRSAACSGLKFAVVRDDRRNFVHFTLNTNFIVVFPLRGLTQKCNRFRVGISHFL